MEGVGARLGRSSTRYGPATVFTGPVRKWKKKWVHVAPSSNTNNASSTTHHSHQINGHNGTSNGNNGSHLLLYKWTPITQSQNTAIGNNNNAVTNGNGGDKVSAKDDDALAANEEPPRRKFKYIPVIFCDFTYFINFCLILLEFLDLGLIIVWVFFFSRLMKALWVIELNSLCVFLGLIII